MDNYTEEVRAEVRIKAIQNMIKLGISNEQIIKMYSRAEYKKAVRRIDMPGVIPLFLIYSNLCV